MLIIKLTVFITVLILPELVMSQNGLKFNPNWNSGYNPYWLNWNVSNYCNKYPICFSNFVETTTITGGFFTINLCGSSSIMIQIDSKSATLDNDIIKFNYPSVGDCNGFKYTFSTFISNKIRVTSIDSNEIRMLILPLTTVDPLSADSYLTQSGIINFFGTYKLSPISGDYAINKSPSTMDPATTTSFAYYSLWHSEYMDIPVPQCNADQYLNLNFTHNVRANAAGCCTSTPFTVQFYPGIAQWLISATTTWTTANIKGPYIVQWQTTSYIKIIGSNPVNCDCTNLISQINVICAN